MATKGFWAGNRDLFPRRTANSYTWKWCPFSTQYVERFTIQIPVSPYGPDDYQASIEGNSTNLQFCKDFAVAQGSTLADYAVSHTTTSGGMNYRNSGGSPGWTCFDPACPYYIETETHYHEI